MVLFISSCTYANNTVEPTSTECEYGTFQINIFAECVSNDSVGNEWVQEYFIDGQKIESGYQITIPLNEAPVFKTITATIKEVDKYPDISSLDIPIEIKSGKKAQKTITVTEDGGCRKGACAVWVVTVFIQHIS